MLLIKTRLGNAGHKGLGLFSEENIEKGTVVWKEHPLFHSVILYSEFIKLNGLQRNYLEKYATYNKNDCSYFLDLDDSRFMNHDDDPNVEFLYETGTAIKNIHAGDELTCDYVLLNPLNANLDFIKNNGINT